MSESIIQRAVELNDSVLAEEALREIDIRLSSSPDENERGYLLFSKASCYRILGDFEQARRQLRIALGDNPNSDTQTTFDFMQGLLSEQEGKHAEALEKFDRTLSAHAELIKRPEMREIYEDIQQRRAFLMVTLSKFGEAVPILTETLSFSLDEQVRSDIFCSLGMCHLELKEYSAARDHLLQAMTIGLTKKWEGAAHFYLGIAYFHSDMIQESKREFQKCEELATLHPLPIADVYSWLSSISRRLGDLSESKRYAMLAKRN